jgi:hypothetical protein
MVAWFLTGLVLSAVLIVVIAPLDLLLLVGLIGAILVQRVVRKTRDPRLVAMLVGALAFSAYTLVWVLTDAGAETSNYTGVGLGVALLVHAA